MEYNDAFEKVVAGLRTLVPNAQNLTDETQIVDDLGLDSLQVMELVMEVEDQLDISIPVNLLSEIHTIGQFARELTGLVE